MYSTTYDRQFTAGLVADSDEIISTHRAMDVKREYRHMKLLQNLTTVAAPVHSPRPRRISRRQFQNIMAELEELAATAAAASSNTTHPVVAASITNPETGRISQENSGSIEASYHVRPSPAQQDLVGEPRDEFSPAVTRDSGYESATSSGGSSGYECSDSDVDSVGN